LQVLRRQSHVCGMSKENRKHARLMQKANRLGAQDLLEIAAMKNMTVFVDPTAPAKATSATEPPPGGGGDAASSHSSTRSASGSVPSAVAQSNSKAPTPPVAEQSELDEDSAPTVSQRCDEDAHLSD
jgi:hypothetical protein